MNSEKTFQITTWGDPNEQILTAWGKLSYKNFLDCEIRRWKDKNFREAFVCENSEGLIALFCWRDELPCPVEGEE